MEKNFYPDNFEQLLKESTDNFRMYPSKRVWHSIYNDLHPSRKWPSLAVWILLVSSIVYIGLSNNSQVADLNNDKQVAAATKELNIVHAGSGPDLKNTIIAINGSQSPAPTAVNSNNRQVPDFNNKDLDIVSQHVNIPQTDIQSSPVIVSTNASTHQRNIEDQGTAAGLRNKKLVASQVNDQSLGVIKNKHTSATNSNKVKPGRIAALSTNDNNDTEEQLLIASTKQSNEAPASIASKPGITSADLNNEVLPDIDNSVKANDSDKEKAARDAKAKKDKEENEKKAIAILNNTSDKEWIEDHAFHNKPFLSKFKSKATYQVYFTPSVGYRILSNKADYTAASTQSFVATSAASRTGDYKEAISQYAAVNMEMGVSIIYDLYKNVRLKGGVQLNYTNYSINAYELKHPTVTTLTLNDKNTDLPTMVPRSTTLANAAGVSSKKLNNNTYQLAVPLGADVKLAGKSNLKWYVGATIQPTFIMAGNAYLISSDLKNYVEDNYLMRKWNVNAGFETFISYQTKSGIIVTAGPQFRYQLLSTYNKQYTYDEKLYNLGLKIGITRKF